VKPLQPHVIDTALQAGLAWTRDGDTLVKVHREQDFAGAVGFVDRVAELAEAANHHPDIDIRYDAVTLRLTTHDIAGLSDLDLALARQIDALAGRSEAAEPTGRIPLPGPPSG
jgi:4a-hydroxytetrahydrobiopterin dehydratase